MTRAFLLTHDGDISPYDLYYEPPSTVPNQSTAMIRAFFGKDTYRPPGKEMNVHRCYPLICSISIGCRFSPSQRASDGQGQQQQQADAGGRRSDASGDNGQGDGPDLTAGKNLMEHRVSWWNMLAVLLAISMGHDTGIPGIGGPATEGEPDEQQEKSSQQLWTIEIETEDGGRLNILWRFSGDMMAIYRSFIPVTMDPPGPCRCSPYVMEHEPY